MLHHTGHGEPHYDLMLERGNVSSLWTFRSPVWPVSSRTLLTELADHRLAYLDYEGTISGARGEVRRIEAGDYYGWRKSDSKRVEISLDLAVRERDGRPMRVRSQIFRLARDASGVWSIEPVSRADNHH